MSDIFRLPIIKLIKNQIKNSELEKMVSKMFGNLVKTVIDIEKETMVVDGELHSDEEAYLIKKGSKKTYGGLVYTLVFLAKNFYRI